MKKFLSFICFLYASIIIYVWVNDLLLNFLAPTLALYIKISLFPILIMGLVLLFNNKVNYKFKISDLILLLPLVMIFIAGDARLTSTLANNRMFTTFRSNLDALHNLMHNVNSIDVNVICNLCDNVYGEKIRKDYKRIVKSNYLDRKKELFKETLQDKIGKMLDKKD